MCDATGITSSERKLTHSARDSDDDLCDWAPVGTTNISGPLATVGSMFAPDPVLDLSSQSNAVHTADELPPGKTVWLRGADDVALLLGSFWERDLFECTCDGQAAGVVQRHQSNLTFVVFSDIVGFPKTTIGITVPTACLTLVQPLQRSRRKHRASPYAQVSLGFGALGPRAHRRASVNTVADYWTYIGMGNAPELAEGTNMLMHDDKEAAIGWYTDFALPTFPRLRRELLSNRAVALLLCGRVGDALSDSIRAIETSPTSESGYLCACRVYLSKGMHEKAVELLSQVAAMCPVLDEELARLRQVAKSMVELQRLVKTDAVKVVLEGNMTKSLVTVAPLRAKQAIVADHLTFGVISSAECAAQYCDVCCAACRRVVSNGAEAPTSRAFCSEQCKKRGLLREAVECGAGCHALHTANSLLTEKAVASPASSQVVAEASFAVKLFMQIYAESHDMSDEQFLAALSRCGLLPPPALPRRFDRKTVGELGVLFTSLSQFLTARDQVRYDLALFLGLVAHVATYAVNVPIPGMALCNLCGCVRRVMASPNCTWTCNCGSGEIDLVALRDVAADEVLTVSFVPPVACLQA